MLGLPRPWCHQSGQVSFGSGDPRCTEVPPGATLSLGALGAVFLCFFLGFFLPLFIL